MVLCLGYRAQDVLAYLNTRSFLPLKIRTVVEPEPLGTGGAVALARALLASSRVVTRAPTQSHAGKFTNGETGLILSGRAFFMNNIGSLCLLKCNQRGLSTASANTQHRQ